MIVGGQWGSEGKGLFAGYIARRRNPDSVVCQFGPNAGHTWIEDNKPIVFKSLPVASIAPSIKNIFLGPGSVINPEILKKEVESLKKFLGDKNIFIHENVATIDEGDVREERGLGTGYGTAHIASTMQGTSEAMIRKIRRLHTRVDIRRLFNYMPVAVVDHVTYKKYMSQSNEIQIEGAQGMDLSINVGHEYPYVTSRDCTPAQVLADCGMHPADLLRIYACIRTYPIRVGNVYNDDGTLRGTSGPYYLDQRELSWAEIGQPEEYTTVTKRVRRIFSFSMMQTRKLLGEVRPDGIFLNFGNYLPKEELDLLVNNINRLSDNIVKWVGYGPKDIDIHELPPPPRKPVIVFAD